MVTKSNWDGLLTGTLNGTITVDESRTANIWAMGSPDIELWVNSWNVSYPDDLLYTRYDISRPENKYEGWFVGNVENSTTKYISVEFSLKIRALILNKIWQIIFLPFI